MLQIRYAGLSDPLQSAASHARHGNQSSCPRWRASTCRKLLHTIVPISTWIDLTWPNWLSTRAARLVVFIKMLLDLLGNVGASRVYTFHVVLNRIPRVHWNSRKTWKNLLHHAIMPFLENHTIRQPLQSWFEVPSQPSVQKAEVFFSLPFYLETKKIDEANRLWNILNLFDCFTHWSSPSKLSPHCLLAHFFHASRGPPRRLSPFPLAVHSTWFTAWFPGNFEGHYFWRARTSCSSGLMILDA